MANYKLFCGDLRVGQATTMDGGITWYPPYCCEAVMVDEFDNVVIPTNCDVMSTVLTITSTEPVEYTDSLADMQRKASSGWSSIWADTTVDDTVTIVFV